MLSQLKTDSHKLRCNEITFEEIRHPNAFWMPKHFHDETHMALLFAGSIESFSSSKRSVVCPSELLFVPAGEMHASQYYDRVHAFYIQFRSSWWERMQQSMPSLGMTHEYRNNLPLLLAMRLYREFQTRDNLTPFMLEGLALELMVTLSRHEDATERSPGRSAPAWLRQVEDFLQTHYAESISIDAIARMAGVHPGHLMRRFRQHYHCAIGDYVRRLRVEHACRLLAKPDEERSIAQIALSLGFADQSHFYKTFKAVTGTTPTAMRNLRGPVRRIQNPLP